MPPSGLPGEANLVWDTYFQKRINTVARTAGRSMMLGRLVSRAGAFFGTHTPLLLQGNHLHKATAGGYTWDGFQPEARHWS